MNAVNAAGHGVNISGTCTPPTKLLLSLMKVSTTLHSDTTIYRLQTRKNNYVYIANVCICQRHRIVNLCIVCACMCVCVVCGYVRM